MNKKMNKNKRSKELPEFQKRIFSKIDGIMKDYMEKKDIKGASAFAVKIKDKLDYMFQSIKGDYNLEKASKGVRDKLLKDYQQQIEVEIDKVKEEVADIIKREGEVPSYIYSIDERRFR